MFGLCRAYTIFGHAKQQEGSDLKGKLSSMDLNKVFERALRDMDLLAEELL